MLVRCAIVAVLKCFKTLEIRWAIYSDLARDARKRGRGWSGQIYGHRVGIRRKWSAVQSS